MLTADGPKVHRVQRPLRRPRVPGRAARGSRATSPSCCRAAAAGEPLPDVEFADDACVTVVLASEGYPASPRTGDVDRRARRRRGASTASPCSTPARARDGDGVRDRGRAGARRHARPARPRRRARRARLRGGGADHVAGRAVPPRHRGDGRRAIRGANGQRSGASAGQPNAGARRPHPGRRPASRRMHRSGLPPSGGGHEARRAPELAAVLALRDGVLGPVLRAVQTPADRPPRPTGDRPDRLRDRPRQGGSAPSPARTVFGRRKGPLDPPLLAACRSPTSSPTRPGSRTWLEVEILAVEAWAKLGRRPRRADAAADPGAGRLRRRRDRGAGAGHRPRRRRLRRRRPGAHRRARGRLGPLRPHVERRRRHRAVGHAGAGRRPPARGRRRARGRDRRPGPRAPRHADGRAHPRHPRRADHVRRQARALGAAGPPRPRAARPGPRDAIAVGKLSGAVGTYSNVDPAVEALRVRARSGSRPVPATQVLARDRHAELLYACASVGATVEAFATRDPPPPAHRGRARSRSRSAPARRRARARCRTSATR